MNISIVLTVISADRPGIIEAVSRVLRRHGGNWTRSSMSSLAGQFAGILLASVPVEEADACLLELQDLQQSGIQIITRASSTGSPEEAAETFSLDLVGNDRPGIVNDITHVLAAHRVSVVDLDTLVEGASMGGGELFKASAQLLVPPEADVAALERELEAIANDLMVDIRLTGKP